MSRLLATSKGNPRSKVLWSFLPKHINLSPDVTQFYKYNPDAVHIAPVDMVVGKVADMVVDMEVDKVADGVADMVVDMEVDKVTDIKHYIPMCPTKNTQFFKSGRDPV